MNTWMLILTLHSNGTLKEMEKTTRSIEIGGFSTRADCEKAGDAAGEVFDLKDGKLQNMQIECSEQ